MPGGGDFPEEIDIRGHKRDYVKLIYFNDEKYYLPENKYELDDLVSKRQHIFDEIENLEEIWISKSDL